LNKTIGWIWPKRIITPALTLDFDLITSHISRYVRVLRCRLRRRKTRGLGRTDRLGLNAGSDSRSGSPDYSEPAPGPMSRSPQANHDRMPWPRAGRGHRDGRDPLSADRGPTIRLSLRVMPLPVTQACQWSHVSSNDLNHWQFDLNLSLSELES
jgi:hypothetical protein